MIPFNHNIVIVEQLNGRKVRLVGYNDVQYVLKTIQEPDELQEWGHELKTLLLMQTLPHIIDIVALVDIPSPYSPGDARVVSGFLIEYGERGSLHQILEDSGVSE